jgi:hypothetical protein
MLQKLTPFVLLTLLFSCSNPVPKFVPKVDSINAVYRQDTAAIPQFFVAKDSLIQTFVPASPGSTQGVYKVDTLWFAKKMVDTAAGHHTFVYIPLDKKFVVAIFGGKKIYN